MKFLSAILISLALVGVSCNDDKVYPDCVNQVIQELKKDPCNQTRVVKYTFQKQIVYVSEIDCCCDMMATVFNEECDEICYLGGIAGLSECLGVKFDEHATNREVVWEN